MSHYPASKERKISMQRIIDVCNQVIPFFKKHRLFNDFSLIYKIEKHDTRDNKYPGCTVSIYGKADRLNDNDNEFIGHVALVFREDDAKYPVKYGNEYKIIRTIVAEIPSVSTNVKLAGQYFGFFLIRLAMIISILGGATILTLDNDTDRPERAVRPVRGIYGLLQPNMRSEMVNTQNMSQFSKKYLDIKAERIRYLEPSDINIVAQNLNRAIKNLLHDEVINNTFGQNFIWRLDADDVLRTFFNDKTIFSSNASLGGKRRKHGKRPTKKQKKINYTHKRRKSSTTRR